MTTEYTAIATDTKTRELTPRSSLVVLGAILSLSVSGGPLLASTQGVFMIPITTEFGWDRAQVTLAGLIGGILSAIALPFVGAAIDRWGIRRVVPIGIVALAINLALLSIVPAVLLIYLLAFGVTGLTATAQGPASYIRTLSRWFDRNRGLAIGVAICGLALGQIFVPQYALWFVTNYSWRIAYLALAVLVVVVALPAVLFMIRDPKPGEVAAVEKPGAANVDLPGLTGRQALSTARFWILVVSIALVAMTVQGALVHIVPLAIDSGWDPVAATSLIGIAGLASVVGRLGGGFLYDRLHAPYVGAGVFIIGAVGVGLLAAGGSPVVAAIAIGITAGAETDLMAFLSSRYFGIRSLAQVNGFLFAAFNLSVPIGIYVLGAGYVAAGSSYTSTLTIFAGGLVAAAVLVLFMPRQYNFPVLREARRRPARNAA